MDNPYILLILGFVVLLVAGELLVRGAVNLALQMRISTLVVGMTVVSFGTSAPELLVSIQAALNGHPGIAIGNVVGSNIANIGLVLGLTALLFPIPVDRNSLRLDWPMMMVATLGFWLFIQDLVYASWEGMISVAVIVAFIVYLIRKSRKDAQTKEEEKRLPLRWATLLRDIGFILAGSLGLVKGADWLVDGAAEIAGQFGVSDHVIGVTVIAFGTSVPELMTSVMAAFRRQMNISIGNLIGSNLFNLLTILGITSMVKEIKVDIQVVQNDVFWLLGISLLLLPIIWTGRRVDRWEGLGLLLIYGIYIVLQVF